MFKKEMNMCHIEFIPYLGSKLDRPKDILKLLIQLRVCKWYRAESYVKPLILKINTNTMNILSKEIKLIW